MLFIPIPIKSQKEEVEEAGYLASASDLMVGLLFVFIIMVVILSQRAEQAENENKSSGPLDSVVKTIGKRIQQSGVPVVIDPASGVITLPADILFERGKAVLNPEGIKVLNQAKEALNGVLPCYIYSERKNRNDCPSNQNEVEIETILIEGHTDSTPLQRGIYTNWHLGLDRARAVYEILTVGPIKNYKNERNLYVAGISSYADNRPNKDDPSDDSKNRRVELRFVLAFKPENNAASNKVIDIQKRLQQSMPSK
jgi:flagellar motor protein MotB